MPAITKPELFDEIVRLSCEYAVAQDLDKNPDFDDTMTMAAAALIAEKAVNADVNFIWSDFPEIAEARKRVPSISIATRENKSERLGFSITRNSR